MVDTDPDGRLTSIVLGDAAATHPDSPVDVEVASTLERYFAGDLDAIDTLEVEPVKGTEFQRAVWQELRAIPPGETITYAELAERVGRPGAFRAVGSANGANPVPIVVPCHRVVNTGGGMGGYAYGLDVKRWLLTHEDALVE